MYAWDTMTSIKHVNPRTIRFWLFTTLLVTAPLSKYPSIATPLFNFSAFRVGFYPLVSLLFVLFSLPSLYRSLPSLYKQSRTTLISTTILVLVSVLGVITALYKARSALLITSILLLIGLLLSAWWYVANELPPKAYPRLLKAVLVAGCIYGAVGIVQFLFAGFGHQTFGLLCANCSSAVFGFPRISGFAAEPQFYANALLLYFFVSMGAFYHTRARLALGSTLAVLVSIGLTFSRGAFMALGLGTILFFVLLLMQKQIRLQTIAKHAFIFAVLSVTVMGLLIGAASYRYRSTPDIAYKTFRSLVQQASVGLIKLPASKADRGSFTPAGLVKASGQDRLNAAHLSLKAWGYSTYTQVLGVGAGNLGPFVVRHINTAAPNNLTVYVFYILILSELGILGLGAFVLLSYTALHVFLKRFWGHKQAPLYTALFCLGTAFLIQYFFFGSYINVPYIWLWFGILLGLGQKPLKSAIIRQRS